MTDSVVPAMLFALVYSANAQGVSFVKVAGFQASGMAHVIGVVRNDTQQEIRYVEIISTIYDANDNYLNSGFTFTLLDVLRPGEESPFQLTIFESARFESFDYQVQWSPARDKAERSATVVSSRGVATNGFFEIGGQVRNNGSSPLEYVQIVATALDANGDIAGVGFAFANIDVLQPGATSPFSIYIMDPIRPIASYALVVQAVPR